MSSELIDRIRQKYADDLKVLEEKPWVLDPKQCEYPETWQETADVRDLLAALEQAEQALAREQEEKQNVIDSEAALVERLAQTEQAFTLTDDLAKGYRTQLAQAQTDLAGVEATAETLRLALAEAEGARDRALSQIEQFRHRWFHVTTQDAIDRAEQAEQRGRAAAAIIAEYVAADEKVIDWAGCFLGVEPDGTGPGDSYTGAVPSIGARLKRAQDWLAALTPPEGSV